jgi:hypothetical protein
MIIPGLVMGLICLMPFLGRWKLGHRFNVGLLFVLLAGVGLLTWLAKRADNSNPEYLSAVAQASKDAERVKVLARSPTGIPSSGAVTLLRNDSVYPRPETVRQELFELPSLRRSRWVRPRFNQRSQRSGPQRIRFPSLACWIARSGPD